MNHQERLQHLKKPENAWTALLICILIFPSLWAVPPQEPERDIYLVLLKQPSVVEEVLRRTDGETTKNRRMALRDPEASSYSDSLEREQREVINRLTKEAHVNLRSTTPSAEDSIEILGRRHYLTNLLIIRAADSAADNLRLDPSVRRVVRTSLRWPLLDTAPQVVNAPAFWDAVPGGEQNAGKGIRIAIIDSGINVNHPMFTGEGLTPPQDFPKGDLEHTNNKVVVARSYHQLFPNTQTNRTPEDQMGHGSRVAAVAAGGQVDAPLAQIQGIAPMAFLGNYKVFGEPGRNSNTTSAAIIAALNDAVEDGMDVINLSLGGTQVDPATDPEQQAIALATEAGIVVVAAAGNNGPNAGTIRSPGTSPDVITVGAVTNGRVFGSALEIISDPPPPDAIAGLPYLPGTDVAIPNDIGPFPMVSIHSLDSSELACDQLPSGALEGKLALVRRGSCLFQDKADHVFTAGAKAMVVFNDIDGGPIVMAFDEERGPGGPAVMIGRSGGELLRDYLLSNSDVTGKIRSEDHLARFPSTADILTGFSSRGPNIDGSIKPDISAVGSGIYSASNRGSEFTMESSGTSFSCPMIAGAAALVLQLNPEWSAAAVKSTLVATAARTVSWNGESAGVNLTGSGRLDLANALTAAAMVDPVSISFGVLEGPTSFQTRMERPFSIKNLSTIRRIFDIELTEAVLNPSVQVTVTPSSVSLAPQQSATIVLTLTTTPPLFEGPAEGYVEIVDRTGESELALAFWGDIVPTDQAEKLVVSKSSPGAIRELSEALRTADPGSIIEISDSSTYSGPLDIQFNAQGTPLNGLSIRAVSGENPVITGSASTTGSAVLTISNLSGVSIEGLKIEGGSKGIEFKRSTGVIRNNRVSGDPEDSSGFGVLLTDSNVHLVGNEIWKTGGSAIAAFRSDALIQGNTIGGSGTGDSNVGNGISGSAGSILAAFDNLIQNSEGGQGLKVSDATALIKGNVIAGSDGEAGDGILAEGTSAEVTIRDNLISNNQRSGVALRNGASGSLLRNRLLQNLGNGIFLQGQSSLVANALELGHNGTGIELYNSSGVISNSVLAFSASDGILSETSSLEVVNTTCFGNAGQGVVVLSPLETKLSNSIFFDNQMGSFSGIEELETRSNLIGDGQHLATNGNISGNPDLEDPDTFIFTPLVGSPVIDSGENQLIRGSTDLYSLGRIVDGTGNGNTVVDLGAVEFASDFSTPLLLPILSVSQENFVGMAITNAHTIPAIQALPGEGLPDVSAIRLRTHTIDGMEVESQDIVVPLQSQESKLFVEYFETLEEGWLELSPSGPDVVSFSLLGNWKTSILDGVPLVSALSRRLIFPEIRNAADETTTFFLINPNDSELTLVLTWRNPGGENLEITRSIPANGMLKAKFRDLFGSATGGYVIAENSAQLPIVGVELFGTEDAIGTLVALDAAAGKNELYAAQLASRDDVLTVLNVINSEANTGVVTFDALSEQGNLIATVNHELDAGAQLRKSAKELFGFTSAVVGWVSIRSSTAPLLGSLSFEDPSGKWLAALPLQSADAREFILSHVAHTSSIFTGVTLLNASSIPALVSFEILDRTGQVTHAANLQLAAQSKRALLLNEWVPAFKEQTGGFIRIRSNTGILGFELFGASDLEYMAAVPQQVTVY